MTAPNTTQQISYLQTNYTTVQVVFIHDLDIDALRHQPLEKLVKQQLADNRNQYTYKADKSLQLKIGDFACVHANNTLKIVQITKVHANPTIDPNASYQYKWVVDKIDLQTFLSRMDEQDNLTDLLKQFNYHEQQQKLTERIEKISKVNKEFAKIWHALSKKAK